MQAQAATLRRIFVLFACAAPFGWAMFWAVFHGVPGQDWVVFHTAAALFVQGDRATLADPRAFTDAMNRTHQAWFAHPITVLHPWVYPPVTLMLALAFGWLPYPGSLAAFLGLTGALLVAALWRWEIGARDRLALVACVFLCPACAFTLGSGQLSFLVAAVVLAGMAWLPTRPFLSGATLSLLCLKPQFVPLIPVALLAGRHWRAIAGGVSGGLALVLASAAIAGVPAWVSWVRFATGANPILGAMIAVVRKYDQSVHTCLTVLGASGAEASVGQSLAMLLAASCVWLAFSRPAPARQRLVVLLCALVFGAPHVGDYDEIMPAIAAALTLLDGRTRPWRTGEAALAACVWLASMAAPPALIAVLGLPVLTALSALTPLAIAGLMVAALPRGVRSRRVYPLRRLAWGGVFRV